MTSVLHEQLTWKESDSHSQGRSMGYNFSGYRQCPCSFDISQESLPIVFIDIVQSEGMRRCRSRRGQQWKPILELRTKRDKCRRREGGIREICGRSTHEGRGRWVEELVGCWSSRGE